MDEDSTVVYDLAKHEAIWNLLKAWASYDPIRVTSSHNPIQALRTAIQNVIRNSPLEQFLRRDTTV